MHVFRHLCETGEQIETHNHSETTECILYELLLV